MGSAEVVSSETKKRKNNMPGMITIELEADEYTLENNRSHKSPLESTSPPILVLIATAFASVCVYKVALSRVVEKTFDLGPSSSILFKPSSAVAPYAPEEDSDPDFLMAKSQSFGFFHDVSEKDWVMFKDRVKRRVNHLDPENPQLFMESPHAWYQNNYSPDFTCPHERRIGGMGDGGKWVCDPHRIRAYSEARRTQGGNGCLVYSIGSAGNFEFETGLQKAFRVGDDAYQNSCEVHVFDIEDFSGETPEGLFFHNWGLESSTDPRTAQGDQRQAENEPVFKSFQETVANLGHQGRVIDIFKIDCEGCEWRIYQDLIEAQVDIRQILVEVHMSPPSAINFFDSLQQAGFVTFHKEPNIIFGGGNCQEYAMIKLAPEFFI